MNEVLIMKKIAYKRKLLIDEFTNVLWVKWNKKKFAVFLKLLLLNDLIKILNKQNIEENCEKMM